MVNLCFEEFGSIRLKFGNYVNENGNGKVNKVNGRIVGNGR
jgi:hypothetical protein